MNTTSEDIQLSNLQRDKLFNDLEKSNPSIADDSVLYTKTATKYVRSKLLIYLTIELVISAIIYYKYVSILHFHPLLAPTLLGASTAALAQSMNQYMKVKLSFNRICKFILWGSVNGCFTVLWIDLLFRRFDNIVYRIIIDQLIGAPTFQLIFSILNSLWDHGEIISSTRASYFRSLKYGYCFWPFFSICLFVFIPIDMMFPANCLANLIWNLILSKAN